MEEPGMIVAAKWRVEQCLRSVNDGEKELERRRLALREAEKSLRQIRADIARATSQPHPHAGEES